jgi:hypothetical protein
MSLIRPLSAGGWKVVIRAPVVALIRAVLTEAAPLTVLKDPPM